MTRFLLSGANGFVGQALGRSLVANGHWVTGLVRHSGGCPDGVAEWLHATPDFVGIADAWPAGLAPDVVVHLAARVHVMNDNSSDPDQAFRATNLHGTLRLAEAAKQNGVRRFVYVSSIKAVAEDDAGRPLREDDPAHAEDAYGRSKLAAERELISFGRSNALDVVIVRPPLVYGPNVQANFLRLMDAIARGIPMPLGAVRARRSMVFVGNLVDALMHCATDPRASGQCFHVADDEDQTVAELVRSIGTHLHRPARLFDVPVAWLRLAGHITGRSAQIDRLIGSLQVDTSRLRQTLDWKPPYTADEGLAETVNWYQSTRSSHS
ncbi:UDP-glucose 4-epimerase family protein [Paraburkholderia largidicola]|uniref:Epimerase/dehydratase n=1 Tax=Paraburkholderia largidicola TaxID=3014751 RepID=A0A7I8BMT6_9BURK|nr:SDR family oxidoreductase [Paraburkholderia sp. PGU16]BCF89410.1 epimerase/dehydratase [Paraburkholderia sp. PGU16]